jgi:glucose-1-phosphate adenylyltransferase
MVTAHIRDGKTAFVNGDQVRIDANGRITSLSVNKGVDDDIDVSLETYVIALDKLQSLIEKARGLSGFYALRDIIAQVVADWHVVAYEHQGYVRHFGSLKQYCDYSLELLNYDVRKRLFLEDWPIYTVTHDTPPAKYATTPKSATASSPTGAGSTARSSIRSSRATSSSKKGPSSKIRSFSPIPKSDPKSV